MTCPTNYISAYDRMLKRRGKMMESTYDSNKVSLMPSKQTIFGLIETLLVLVTMLLSIL